MPEITARADARKAHRAEDAKSKSFLHYLGVGVSAGLFGLVLLIGALVIVIPQIAGATPLTVLTSSMEPGLPPGTLIVVKPIETNEIAIGDVITYQIESGKLGVITHRITGIANSSDGTRTFTLKGDNNDAADEREVLPIQVIGTLWYSVPWIGNVSNYANGGQSWLVPVIAVGLFAYAGFMIMSGVASSVRKRKRVRARADRDAERAASIDAMNYGDAHADTVADAVADAVEPVDNRVRLG